MIGTSEKRSQDAEEFDQKIKILIVDIEGTTTSISFVKDTLFPYIRENLQVYLKSHWKEPEFVEDLTLLRKQAESDKENGVEGLVPIPAGNDDDICQAVANNILWQMDLDRKTKALKQLQGHVMREGYMNGKLKGHVYDDVQPALKSWKHSGRQVYVYSSGSVAAQKLLFEFSEKGDLLELFSGHFDTDIGSKIESSSYTNIAKQLNCKCEEMMFLTDIPKEAVAAREAGLHAVLVARPGNAPLTDDDSNKFRVIKSFDDIVFEASAKRKKLSVEEPTANNTVSDESSNNTNSDMQMDVDVDESCPKVSEGATSESQEKSQSKSEEGAVLQNGSAKKEDGKQKMETSSEEEKVNKAAESKRDGEESEPEKSASKPNTDSSGSVSVVSSKNVKTAEEAGREENKVDIHKKTEHISKDADKVDMDVPNSESSKKLPSAVEAHKDEIAGANETKETAESQNEKMETDRCTVEKRENQEEKSATISKETKTVERTEEVKPEGSASDTIIPGVPGDVKTVESDAKTVEPPNDTKTADTPNEAESVDSTVESKIADSSGETKTVDSADKTKTAEIDEAKTVQTTNKEKTASNAGEEKTVHSPCGNKNVESHGVETTSINGKELKASDKEKNSEAKKHVTKVPEKMESKIPEVVKEAKVSKVAEKVKTPEVVEDDKALEIAKEVKAPELTEKLHAPEVAEEVKASDGEVVMTEIAEEVKASEVAEKLQTTEVSEKVKLVETAEVKVPEVTEKAKTLEIAEEVKMPGVTENAKVPENAKEEKLEKASEARPLETANEVLEVSKTIEELQTSKSVDEKMEKEESKTDESTKQLKTSDTVKNDALQTARKAKMEELGTEDSKNEKMIQSDVPKKDSEDPKKEEECKSLENAEAKMDTDNSQEKLVEKDNQDKADKKHIETACPENGETDVKIGTTAASDSSDSGQKEENKIDDKEVPMNVVDDKTTDNDSSTKKDEAMETDGQDSKPVDKDTPMDVESTETSPGNGENVEVKNDVENVKEVESKTNGINNSHITSPAENDTNKKILDNETIKIKKTEESEASKLITPPSAQS